MERELTEQEEGWLAAQLVREWTTARLTTARVNSSVQAECTGQGVPMPTQVGEYGDPIEGVATPHFVEVLVALPGRLSEAEVQQVIDYLSLQAEEDMTLGGRLGRAQLNLETVERDRHDHQDQGEAAWQLTLPFAAREPGDSSDE